MATVKRMSHPVFVRGPFDIFKKLDPALTSGSAYGQYSYASTVYFYNQAEETGVRLLVSGYATATTALLEDNIYWLSGRLIAPNAKVSPMLYFEHELNFLHGEASECVTSLANKVALYGFGIVIGREDYVEVGNNSENVKSLMVTLKHLDYDNQAKQQVSFSVKYKIGGDRNLAKTFGLFQIGREVLIAGYICGYDTDGKTWIVHALNISLASGHQSSVAIVNETNYGKKKGRGRGKIIDLESDDVEVQPKSNSSNIVEVGQEREPVAGSLKGKEVEHKIEMPVEDGEVLEKEGTDPFVNTYGKRRSHKQVIADAKKAAKYI